MRLRTIATPLTIGSFIAVCSTGLCLLFGYRGGLVDPVHEVSSILFVAGSILHIAINWKPTLAHLKMPLGAGLAVCFAAASALALIPHGDSKGNPRNLLGQAMAVFMDSNLQEVARITRRPEQELANSLAQAGCKVDDPKATLRDIARSNGKNPMAVLAAVLPPNASASGRQSR